MAWISQAVGGALGTIGTIIGNIGIDKTRGELLTLRNEDPKYTRSQAADQQYGLAQNLLNARMPGYADMQQNIFSNEANADQNIDNSATDASQALAMKAMAHANTNKSFENLGQMDQQDYYNRLANMNNASQVETNENDKVYEDAVRQWQDRVNIAMTRGNLRSQQGQNMVNLGGMFSGMSFGGGGAGGGK